MRIVSIVGYSNSGKTTVATALVAEARGRGLRTAAIKVGHPGHTPPDETQQLRKDTDRLTRAGADPTVFRTPQRWVLELTDLEDDRDGPLELPRWLQEALKGVDLLVVEGRIVTGATVVQTIGPEGRRKFKDYDMLITDAPADPLPEALRDILTR